MKETSRKLFYILRNCYTIWFELSGWKGSVTYGPVADLSLPRFLSVTTGIWTLTHKSDLRAEISGSIVWYDALAPSPEVLMSWYSVCACAVSLQQKFLFMGRNISLGSTKSLTPKMRLTPKCLFNSSLKLGIGNDTDHCSSKSCLVQFSSIVTFTISNLSFLWKGEPS